MSKGKFIDLTGEVFGRLTVIERDKDRKRKNGGRTIMWICKCSCKDEKIISVRTSHLNSGNVRSCGCYRRELLSKPFGEASTNALLRAYKRSARNKNMEFSLTREEFVSLLKNNCFYCGIQPYKYFIHGKYSTGGITYNGIDRKNNHLGYTSENCVSCCEDCNRAKLDMEFSYFISFLERITAYRMNIRP